MAAMLIVGAGKAGLAIVARCLEVGLDVRVLERRPEHVDEVRQRFERITITLGSGTDVADLEHAGIRNCDTVVAATGSDEVNLVVATLAKYEFSVARVLARVVDPRNRWLFEEDMGVDGALDQTSFLVEQVMANRAGPS